MVERHLRFWVDTGDFDVENQEGFWLYTAYQESLPPKFKYLADRLMNLRGEEAIRQTMKGILSLLRETNVDWDQVLSRPSPAPVRL